MLYQNILEDLLLSTLYLPMAFSQSKSQTLLQNLCYYFIKSFAIGSRSPQLYKILIVSNMRSMTISISSSSLYLLYYIRPQQFLLYENLVNSTIRDFVCLPLLHKILVGLAMLISTILLPNKSSFRIHTYSISILTIRLKTSTPTQFHQCNAILLPNYSQYN